MSHDSLVDIVEFRYPTLAAAVATLVLAAWVFWLSPGSRLHRALALLFGLKGVAGILFVVSALPWDVPGRVAVYFLLAIPFVAAHVTSMMWSYRAAHEQPSLFRSRWLTVGLAAGALFVESLYFLDHDLYVGPAGVGPLVLVGSITDLVIVGLAVMLTVGQSQLSESLPRKALFLVGLAFLVQAGHSSASAALGYAGSWENLRPLFRLQAELAFVALIAVLATPVLAAVLASRNGRTAASAGVWHMVVAVGLALLSAVVADWVTGRAPPPNVRWTRSSLNALWQLGLVGLASFAIVRYRFLDLEVRVRRGLSHGVVAGAFVATFFVFTEGLATYLSALSSPYIGILATGSLLFVLAPLRRFGDRLARAAMPHAIPIEDRTPEERLALFAEQTRIAWEDGVLTAKERRMLDLARERLGLTETQAARIERKVLEENYPSRPHRRGGRAASASDPWAVRP